MASRSRYVKLDCGPAPQLKITSKNSIVGTTVISDYIDGDLHRVLVVERALTATGHRASKPKPKKADTRPQPPPELTGLSPVRTEYKEQHDKVYKEVARG